MSQKPETLEPYVGPRPFQREEKEFFFGRRLEVNDLVSLITAYQVVLLYAQSGAGKTSLLKASLIPHLEEQERFHVLEPARVRRQGTSQLEGDEIRNVFVFNALSSWKGDDISHKELAQMSFKDFLENYQVRGEGDSSPMILVFDQFEEIFTHHLDRWEDREDFFAQIREALEADTHLRVYFVMREDYIAELDPYAQIVPGKLRTRFRMERLRRANALEAIIGPLEAPSVIDKQRRFDEGVAEALVDDLLKVHVQTSSGEKEVPGQFVEPVQLQVVCQSLWHELKSEDKLITFDHLKEFGDVNEALTRFYERTLQKASLASGVSEGALRRWFDRKLITPDGNRATVLRGSQQTAGLVNSAIEVFEAERLLRSEPRDGRLWYELSQDRLIRPIQSSYKKWLAGLPNDEQTRLMLEDQAASWARTRDKALLLDPGQTLIAKRWIEGEASGNYSEALYALVQSSEAEIARAERERERQLTEEQRLRAEAEAQRATALEATGREQELRLQAERQTGAEAQARMYEQARSNRRLRFMLAGVAFMFLLALGTAAYALVQRKTAQDNYRLALESEKNAYVQKTMAERAKQEAERESKEAQKARDEAQQARDLAEVKRVEAENQKQRANDEAAKAKAATLLAQTAKQDLETALETQKGLVKTATEAEKAAVIAGQQAKAESVISKSRELAATAISQLDEEPELGLLLAIKAAETNASKEARDALLRAIDAAQLRSVISDDVRPLAAVFSRDMKSVITTSANGEIERWNAPAELRPSQGESVADDTAFRPNVVAVNADGTLLAMAKQGQVRLWRFAASKTPVVWKPLGFEVRKMAISPDGSYLLISGGQDVLLYDVAQQTLRAELKQSSTSSAQSGPCATPTGQAASTAVNGLEFSPTGDLAAVTQGCKAVLWGSAPGQRPFEKRLDIIPEIFPLVTLEGHIKPVNMARFSRDGKYVITMSDDTTARLWETNGKLIYQFAGHQSEVIDAGFSPDALLVATAGKDGTARVWDIQTGLAVTVLRGHRAPVTSVSFSEDGKFVLTTGEDNTTRVWQLTPAGKSRQLANHRGELSDVAISPDGKLVATSGYDKTTRVWDIATGKSIALLAAGDNPIDHVLFTSDGKKIVTIDYGGIQLWDTGEWKMLYDLRTPGGKAVSADGKFTVRNSLSSIGVYDNDARQPIANLTAPEAVTASDVFPRLAISPDHTNVAAAYLRDGRIFVWDLKRSGQPVQLKLPTSFSINTGIFGAVVTLAFSPDSQALLVTGTNGAAFVWNLRKPNPAVPTLDLTDPSSTYTRGAAFSSDGKYICIWGGRTARIWDATLGLKLSELTGHTGEILDATFSGDSRLLVTVSLDQTAKVWDVASGSQLTDLQGHTKAVSAAVFSNDNRFVITSSYDSTARIFSCAACGPIEEILEKARALAFHQMTDAEVAKYLSPTTGCETCGDLSELLASACKRGTRTVFTPEEKKKFQLDSANLETCK